MNTVALPIGGIKDQKRIVTFLTFFTKLLRRNEQLSPSYVKMFSYERQVA